MRKAERIPSAFFRALRACLLAALLLTLAGCADRAEPAVTSAPPAASEPGSSVTPGVPEEIEVVDLPAEGDLFLALSEDVACYSEPSDSPEHLLGTMKKGTRVTRLEEQGAFMRVQWNEGEVWCRSWYLAAEDPALEAERDAERMAALSATPGYTAFDEPQECFTTASLLNCREMPSTDCAILDQLSTGTAVTLYGEAKSFGLVRLPDGRLCFCSMNYLTTGVLCAVYPGAVDLRALLPRAQFDLLFASPNNVTGHALYPPVPLLENHTADMLYEAYQIFLEDGYLLKIYDAYRPLSAQYALFDAVQDVRFIADPENWGSWHQRGRAVDISLVDLNTGEELEMPTPMHTFTTTAMRTRSSRWSDQARANVDYMTEVMTGVGFGIIDTEWWHFEYTGQGAVMPINLNYDALSFRPASEYFR